MSVFRFHQCVVDPVRREISLDGQPVDVQPLVFDLLLFFVQNPNRVVTKDEMLRAAWRSTVVSDSVVARGVMKLRRAIGDDAAQAKILLTVHRVGYRFAADVLRTELAPLLPQASLPPVEASSEPAPAHGLAVSAFENLSGDTTIDALLPELDQVLRHLVADQVPLASVTASDALQAWQAASATASTTASPATDALAQACRQTRAQQLAVLSVVRSAGQYTVRVLRGSCADDAVTTTYTGPDLLRLVTRVADVLGGANDGGAVAPDDDLEFWQAQYSRAVRLHRHQRPEPALELLQLCRAHLPPTLPMLLMQSRLHLSLGEPQAARAELGAAAALAEAENAASMRFDVQLAQAELAIAEGDAEQAVQACLQASSVLRSDPALAGEAPKLILRFAEALSAGGRGGEAIQLAERAVATAQRLGQRSAELSCRVALGETLIRFRQLHRAADVLRRVTEAAQPADSLLKLDALLMLAEVEQAQHHHRDSVELALQARALARRVQPGRVGRAMALELQGLLGSGETEAVAQLLRQRWGFEGGLDPAAPPAIVQAHAVVLWRQGQGDAAIAALRDALDTLPSDAPAAQRASLATELCFMLASRSELTSLDAWAEPLGTTSVWLRARLQAAVALAAGRRAQAREALASVWFEDGSHPWDSFDVGVDLAWMLLEDGDQEALERVIAQVLEMPSDHGPVELLQTAYALPAQQDDQRDRDWQRSVSMYPGLLRRHPGIAAGFLRTRLPELLTRACY